MSLIKSITALASGASGTAKDTKVSQLLSIKISGMTLPVAGARYANSDLIDFLSDILITTKLTRSQKTLAVNMSLWDLIKLSTDYKGMCYGLLADDIGQGFEINIPILQSDGVLDGDTMDWQIDIVNNSAVAFNIDIYGNSMCAGTGYLEYQKNSLENQLQADVVCNFDKINIETTFNKINAVMGGKQQEIQPEDAVVYMNLNDEVVVDMFVPLSDASGIGSAQIIFPSQTGSVTFVNAKGQEISQLTLFRLQAGASIAYSTVTFKTV
jgi:hypothetical protein